jgi:drug/metabolite transporter (DMT)-like permease
MGKKKDASAVDTAAAVVADEENAAEPLLLSAMAGSESAEAGVPAEEEFSVVDLTAGLLSSQHVIVDEEPIGGGNSRPAATAAVPHHFKIGVETWFDKFALAVALAAWYTVGVLAIVTTKLLLMDWKCPPLVLTVQQMVLASFILRLVALSRDGAVQPWPWEHEIGSGNRRKKGAAVLSPDELTKDRVRRHLPWIYHPNFILTGVFNALDFVCSNYAFSYSAAHFVETIKASDPITTTAIALLWKVDGLGGTEAASLSLLIAGVLMSTWGNSTTETDASKSNSDDKKFYESVSTAVIAMCANLFFAFRAMNQKKYRTITNESLQMDDINFLGRLCQVGAIFLIPMLLLSGNTWTTLLEAWGAPGEVQLNYFGLSAINAFSYVTYK